MPLHFRSAALTWLALFLVACGGDDGGGPTGGWSLRAPLPEPVSNNAVAAVEADGRCFILSALGIGTGLDHAAVTSAVYVLEHGDDSWVPAPAIPSASPRVAASAAGLGGKLYVLGGYSIAANGDETSFDTVDVYDPIARSWSQAAPLPTPIDDAVALAWLDRYIVVVSGWSNAGSVATVQLYDSQSDEWSMATDFPGSAVFGHAGAIDGHRLVVIDGVATAGFGFELVNQAWQGELDPSAPGEILWTDLGQHPGPPRYRAAGGARAGDAMWFHGGTDVPYNFDGLAYSDGSAAPPLATTMTFRDGVFALDDIIPKPTATMDHRALARCGSSLYAVGGLAAGPAVSAEVWTY